MAIKFGLEKNKSPYIADLIDKTDSLPQDRHIAVTCSVGNRTSIAVSILEKAGFKNVCNFLGGMTARKNLGYPTQKFSLVIQ